MRWAMGLAGTLLLVFGLVVWLQGVEYTRDRTVIEVGPLEAKVEEERHIPRSVGVLAAIGGVALIAAGLAGRRV